MLSELCKLHSLGRQHNTLATVRESGLKWENWKNTYFFLLQDPSRKEKCFLTYLRGKAASRIQDLKNKEISVDFQKVLRCLLCMTASLTFLVFHVLDSWEDSCSVLWRVCLYWGLSHGFIMVRLGWGVALASETPEVNWPSCHILSRVRHHMTHRYWCWPWSPGWGLPGSPLSSYPTPAPTIGLFTHRNSASLSPLYPGSPLHPCSTTGCKLCPEDPHSPHPVPVMHDVIIISRTKITRSRDQRPSSIISTQTKTLFEK